MKNLRKEKGITLIALIITVVVLLILAVVSISTIQNHGIIEHANSTTTKYEEEADKEKDTLQSYEKFENQYMNELLGENNQKEEKPVENTTNGNVSNSNTNVNDDDEWTKNY